MTDTGLTPQQIQVIDALSSGANLTEAAALAGVHRNTVARWRRNFARFHAALAQAQYDRALMFRERAEALADRAFETLRDILADPKASPSVRLKAATFIIEKAVTPAPPKSDKVLTYNDLFNVPLFADSPDFEAEPQPDEAPEPAAPTAQKCTTPPNPQTGYTMHKDAQPREPYRRPDPKIGRNDPCPCGSGRKFKRCCLGKPLTAAA
ncbi:MAG: SEC-C metal-binding domain-containing protein [Bryobacteraceae bacterium]